MKILITGHKGFIGSHVYETLTRKGHETYGLDFPDDIGEWDRYEKVLINQKFSGKIM